MRAGKLRKLVAIEQRDSGQDATGQQAITWTQVAEVYAAIEPISGRELIAAQAVQNEVTHDIAIRFLPSGLGAQYALEDYFDEDYNVEISMAGSLRVNFGGRYFNVLSVRNIDERDRVMMLRCAEGLKDG